MLFYIQFTFFMYVKSVQYIYIYTIYIYIYICIYMPMQVGSKYAKLVTLKEPASFPVTFFLVSFGSLHRGNLALRVASWGVKGRSYGHFHEYRLFGSVVCRRDQC